MPAEWSARTSVTVKPPCSVVPPVFILERAVQQMLGHASIVQTIETYSRPRMI